LELEVLFNIFVTMRKFKAYIDWFIGFFFAGALGLLTEWFMFPISWIFRGFGKNSPFWIWMDDSRFNDKTYNGFMPDYSAYLILNGSEDEETFWIAYKWHLRNAVWNLKSLLKPTMLPFKIDGNNNIIVIETVIDELYNYNDNSIPQDSKWEAIAGLKYIPIDTNQDKWQVNQGDEISIETSILGTGFIWYEVLGDLSFKYSQCIEVNYLFWKGYRTIQLGTSQSGFRFTVKHQAIKPWK
jgi:hypothetical protein